MSNVLRPCCAYRAALLWLLLQLVPAVAATAQGVNWFAQPELDVAIQARVHAFAVSPDGAIIAAAGSRDDAIAVVAAWDVATGSELVTRDLGAGAVFCLDVSTAGTIAVGLTNGTVWLIRPEPRDQDASADADQMDQWRASEGAVLACAFSPDGSRLATAGSDRVVRIWNMIDGSVEHTLRGHSRSVWSLEYNGDGGLLASGGADGGVMLWDTTSAEDVGRWQLHRDSVSSLAFHPDGESLLSAGWDGNVLLMDIDSGQVTIVSEVDRLVFSAAISPDGSVLATGLAGTDGEPTLQFWHLPSKTLLLTLGGTSNRGVRFMPDGVGFAASTTTGDVRAWQLRPDTLLPATPDGARAATVRWNPASALFYEVQTGASLPLRASDRVSITLGTSFDLPETTGEEAHWWRVRARGFGTASEWTQPREAFPGAVPAATPRVWIVADPDEAVVGDVVTVRVMVEGADKLAGFEAAITIRPALVDVEDVQEGPALGADGVATFWKLPTILPDASRVRLTDLASARLGAGGIDADGALVALRLRARTPGDLDITIHDLRLFDEDQRLLLPEVTNGVLTILSQRLLSDVNVDGNVDILDLIFVARLFGQPTPDAPDDRADVNGDGVVDLLDLLLIARDYSRSTAPAASAHTPGRPILDGDAVAQLRMVRGALAQSPWPASAGDASTEDRARLVAILDAWLGPPASGTVIQLGRNYPNPSNPETWFPFALSKQSTVTVEVHDMIGLVVRRLHLGPRHAGEHFDRAFAAHWDGRTGTGEPAASGLYVARVVAAPSDGDAPAQASIRFVLAR